MKKIILSTIITLSSLFAINAQDGAKTSTNVSYGLKAGYNSFIARASDGSTSASASVSGFYFGVFADFEISEKFNIQPEVQYVLITEDGADGNVLVVPVMGKYELAEKFSVLAGPQFDYILDQDSEGIKKFGIGLAAGLMYDVSDNIFLDFRYSYGLSNRLEGGDEEFGDSDINVKFNYLQVGVGYKF